MTTTTNMDELTAVSENLQEKDNEFEERIARLEEDVE